MNKFIGYIYQYIVLIAIIILLTLSFIKTNEFNEMLLGALIGTICQVPVTNSTRKKEDN